VKSRRTWVLIGLVILAAGAAVAFALRRSRGAPPLSVELEVRARRSTDDRYVVTAGVGDEVTVRARGATAVWVYHQAGRLIARCPGSPRCRTSDGGVELTFAIDRAVRHRVVAISKLRAMEPSGDFDADVLAARRLGADVELRAVQAAAGSP